MPYFTNRGITPIPVGGAGITPTSAESAAYLARTSGIDNTHQTFLDTLITGLVSDGVWAKLDALYIFANFDETNALLNLVSASYPCVSHGSPTFTQWFGFTGVSASTTVYLDTQFNPTTASPSPKFTQNSAHISAWSNTNAVAAASAGSLIGSYNGSIAVQINPASSDGSTYWQCNSTGAAALGSTNSLGFYVAERTSSVTMHLCKDGIDLTDASDTSGAPANLNIYILGINISGSAANGAARQVTCASIGGSLIPGTDFQALLYARLRTYMTAVGVP